MRAFDIGLSALRANQQSLAVHGNNIANASTPGYHRQRTEQAARASNLSDPLRIGRGVDVVRITRLRSAAVENALIQNSSLVSFSEGALDVAVQLENIFAPNDGGIHDNLSDFFTAAEKTANAPQDMTVRREFLGSASRLVEGFRAIDTQLHDLNRDVLHDLRSHVSTVNGLLNELSQVNERIRSAGSTSSPPNNLLDRRDQIHLELAEYVDVSVRTLPDGSEAVVMAGGALLDSATLPPELTLEVTAADGAVVTLQPSGKSLPITGGRIASLLDAVNQVIPEALNDLQTFAQQIVRAVDLQHATGLPNGGPYRSLIGTRGVGDVTRPFADNENTLPVEAGALYITVTELSTGLRRTQRVDFDPAVDSLTDLAARIDALPDVAAFVDPGRGTMSIVTPETHRFDFAGRPDNQPELGSWTGTSVPEFSGSYTGFANDTWSVTFSGAGTVGVTPGLKAIVRNAAGEIQAELDVGEGYSPGTELPVADGIMLQLESGSVAAGDTASIFVISEPDETGILAATGLNSLFEGTVPGDFRVRSELEAAPEDLAVSATGFPGDAFNMAALSDLRDVRHTLLGELTFTEYLADLTADTGLAVRAADNQLTQLTQFEAKLLADRDAVSGVDVNEELLQMMQLERSFQAAARFVNAIDETLQEILSIGR
jgi:flagellar hook-associated protein 1 FlgK